MFSAAVPHVLVQRHMTSTTVPLSSGTLSTLASDTQDDANFVGPSPSTSQGRPKVSAVWDTFFTMSLQTRATAKWRFPVRENLCVGRVLLENLRQTLNNI